MRESLEAPLCSTNVSSKLYVELSRDYKDWIVDVDGGSEMMWKACSYLPTENFIKNLPSLCAMEQNAT